jgi:hypothetical protein
MRFWGLFERRAARICYGIGGGALGALTLPGLASGEAWGWGLAVVTLVVLGPFAGIAALPLAVAAFTGGPASVVLGAVFGAGVAAINIPIVRSWARKLTGRPRRVERMALDRAAGAGLFLFAASAHVALCFVAGGTAFVAHGVDVPVPDEIADPIVRTAGIAWCTGFATAVTGLVWWVVSSRRTAMRRVIVAAADVLVQIACIALILSSAA